MDIEKLISRKLQIKMMKFFLSTSVPRILKESYLKN